jgi:outer membrane murein-binding lipoprotein Lpp
MTHSSSLAMSRQRYAPSQNSVSYRDKTRTLGPISNTIILIVLACLLGLLYLTQVTKTNTLGYQVNHLQQKQSQLESQHSDLEVASARLQSVQRVKHSDVAKHMTPVKPSGVVKQ